MTAQTWGIVTTLKAPEEQALAFIAHHLTLGPAHMWLHFDDPRDPTADVVEALGQPERITVIRCDAAYWATLTNNPPTSHQRRQAMNIRRVYEGEGAALNWLAHIDVDEFLVADEPITAYLGRSGDEYFRVEPYEALHDPRLGDDIFSSRFFHRAARTRAEMRALAKLHGRFGDVLQKGMLSHVAGKCFFRTGVEGLRPSIHGAKLARERLKMVGFMPGIALLHFHAQDPERWLGSLDFRLSKGAYRTLPELQAFLRGADDEELTAFYKTVQLARPDYLRALERLGMLRRQRLDLRVKVAALREVVTPPTARPA